MRDIQSNRQDKRRSLLTNVSFFAAALAVVSLPGCHFLYRPGATTPVTARAKPALPYEITKAELINHLHENADRVRSWISRDCHLAIKTPAGLPVRLKATIACEEPRNFRLVADGHLVVRADIGSNNGFCWWHMQPGENVLYTVPHEQLDYVRNHPLMQQTMSMPFEPDWLMEVLGVTRVASSAMTLHRDTHPEHVNLVSEHHTKDGRMFRRVTVVDLHGGHVIAHRMVDSSNHTIARAKLSDFHLEGGAKLPGRIEVDWPTMDMSMAITVRNLDVNGELGANLWQPPTSKHMNVVSLPEHLRRVEQSGHQFKKMALNPDRPSDRPLYDENVRTAGATERDTEMLWEDTPAPSRKWFRWPFSRR